MRTSAANAEATRRRSKPRPAPPDPARIGWPALAALIGVAVLSFAWVTVRLWTYTADDTFISLRYAQHLASGHGLVYNLGDRVEGYTNFLWTVLLAVPFLLHVEPLAFLKIANLLLALGSAYGLYRLGRSAGLTSSPATAVIAAAVLLASPALPITAVEGLETVLFTCLLILFAGRIAREAGQAGFPWSGVLLALLAMTRPDGAPLGLACLAIVSLRPGALKPMMKSAAVFVALYGAYFIARRLYYGQWLPNTFYAKGGGDPVRMHESLQSLIAFWLEYGGVAWLLIVPVLVRRDRWLATALVAVIALRLAFQYWSGGPWMGHYRFLIPVLPFVILLVLSGVEVVPLHRALRAPALVVVGALLVGFAWHDHPAWASHYLTYARGLRAAHVQLGLDLRAHTTPDAVIAMDDAGAGPFYAERRNVDMLGLTDAHIAHLPGRFYDKYDVPYVLGQKPDIIVLLSQTVGDPSPNDWLVPSHQVMSEDAGFRSRYTLARQYRFADDYHLRVYRRNDTSRVAATW